MRRKPTRKQIEAAARAAYRKAGKDLELARKRLDRAQEEENEAQNMVQLTTQRLRETEARFLALTRA